MFRLTRALLILSSVVALGACNLTDDEPPETAECGNGATESGEACDDGNTEDGDYCAADCSAITGSCGDGTKQDNEACDDGNDQDGDTCNKDCTEVLAVCGNGDVEADEVCDDGNTDDGDYCAGDCSAETGSCGDDTEQTNEACDDGNNEDGDYCSADCTVVTGRCGDAALQAGEQCDDGNQIEGDLCDMDCNSVPLVYDQNATITTATDWGAGADVTVQKGVTLTIAAPLVIGEGSALTMERDSRIVLASGGSLTTTGSEANRVTILGDEDTCGLWGGIESTNSDGISLTWTEIAHANKGVLLSDSDLTLRDVTIRELCNMPDSTKTDPSGRSAIAVSLDGGTLDVIGLTVSDVSGEDAAPPTVSGDSGESGGDAVGVDAENVVAIPNFERVNITRLRAGRGSGPLGGSFLGSAGPRGGSGGEAGGVRLQIDSPDVVTLRSLFVSDLRGGDGAIGADGLQGLPGPPSVGGMGSSGSNGGSGGNGGNGGSAAGVAVFAQQGGFVIDGVVVYDLQGGDGANGGRGGQGGTGGSASNANDPTQTYAGGTGGAGGNGGNGGSLGVTVGVFGFESSGDIRHATIYGVLPGVAGAPGSGGFSGFGGSGSDGSPGANGPLGRDGGVNDNDGFLPACVLLVGSSSTSNLSANVTYNVFAGSPDVSAVVVRNHSVVSSFNVVHGFTGVPYDNATLGAGDMSVDPQFVSAELGDFTPAAGSPLIDAAMGSSATLDALGRPRDAMPDIGGVELITN